MSSRHKSSNDYEKIVELVDTYTKVVSEIDRKIIEQKTINNKRQTDFVA